MFRSVLVFIFLFSLQYRCFSQYNIVDPKSAVNQTAPLPPDLANIGQYVMSPPNLSNGLPQQNVSLFELKENGVSFPVSLFYNYSGFRVKEEATSVGLGWGITEAMIIREVKHVPDEHTELMKKFEDYGENYAEEIGHGSVDNQYSYTGSQVDYQGDQGYHNFTFNRQFYKYYDAQPDVYILNCAGYTAKFFWLNNQAVKIDQNDLIITTDGTPGEDMKFIVKTPEGLQFSFLPMDYTEISAGSFTNAWLCNNSQMLTHTEHRYTIGWRLTEMKSTITGQIVRFRYKPNLTINEKTVDQVGFFTLIAPLQLNNVFLITNYRSDDTYTKTVSSTFFFDEIESEHYKIKFITDSRLDNDQYRIKQIKIFNKTNLLVPLKTIDFIHGYFGNSASPDNSWLKLAGVKLKGAGEDREYNFSYISENNSAVYPKSSLSIDHWGYYNGYPNQSLVPYSTEIDFRIRNNSSNSNVGLSAPFGNREPVFNEARLFALEKVIYPTKGYTLLTYESSNGKGIRVKSQEDNDGLASVSHYYEYSGNVFFPAIYSVNEFYSYQNCGTNVPGNLSQYPTDLPINTISYTYSSVPDATSEITDNRQPFFDQVTDFIGSPDGKGGKTVYKFAQINAIGKDVILIEKNQYKWGESNPVAWEKYNYSTPVTKSIRYWRIPELYNQLVPSSPCASDPLNAVVCAPTDPEKGYVLQNVYGESKTTWCYWKRLDEIESYQQGVATRKRFLYRQQEPVTGIPKHTNPIRIEETLSDMSIKSSYLYYPGDADPDINRVFLGIPEMYDNNNVNFRHFTSPVIKTKTFIGNHLLSSDVLHYSYDALNGILVKSDHEQLPAGIETGKIKYQFRYNSKANLTDVNKENDVPQSFIWDFKNLYVSAKVLNAKSNEIFFDGLEEPGSWVSPVSVWPTVVNDESKFHTGKYAGKITNVNSSEIYYHSVKWLQVSLLAATKFKYSGWFYSDGPSCEMLLFMKTAGETGYYSYVDVRTLTTIGKWTLLEAEYTVPANVVQLNLRIDNNGGGSIWFDDIRLYPASAQMTSFTYDPLVGMTSTSDINNRSTNYEYDAAGRLKLVRDQDYNIIRKICYTYAGLPSSCDPPVVKYSLSGANLTSNPWTVTVFNANFNQTYSIGLTTSVPAILADIPAGIYTLAFAPMYPGSVTSPIQLLYNNTVTAGTSFNLTNITINSATSFTLQLPPVMPVGCSFNMQAGFSSPTNGINNTGGTVSSYLVFTATNSMQLNTSYYIANITSGCLPTGVRTIYTTSAGRNWTIVIYPGGQVYVTPTSGSAVAANTTTSFSGVTYTL